MDYERSTLYFDGTPIYTKNIPQFMQLLTSRNLSKRMTLVITLNVAIAVGISRNIEYVPLRNRISAFTVDGWPIEILARILSRRSVDRITGVDLLFHAIAQSANSGTRIAIIGGDQETMHKARLRVNKEYPRAQLLLIPVPYITSRDFYRVAPQIASKLKQFRPRITFICLGSPKQERLGLSLVQMYDKTTYIGAGAALNFLAGTSTRAPKIVRRFYLEWLWRLAHEPIRLFHRYLIESWHFLPIIFRSLAHAYHERNRFPVPLSLGTKKKDGPGKR